MKPKKTFDCIAMKDAIQAKLAKEYEGLTDAERWRRVEEKLATSNSAAARKWREIAEHERLVAQRSSS